jgi:hypothetical protein
MVIFAIDPGKSGGYAILGEKLEYGKMPISPDGEIDVRVIESLLKKHNPDLILLEKVHSIFGTSAKSNFSFGFGNGAIYATCLLQNKQFIMVEPKKWQAVAWQGINKVKDPKKNSLAAAHRLFPEERFLATERSSVAHDGIVDAVLIAYWGKNKHTNQK